MNNEGRTKPLEIKVENGVLTISIGVSTLCYVVQQELYDISIHDEDAFVKDFLVELQQEDEEGSNYIHLAFDKAANNVVENGSPSVTLAEDE